MSAAQSAHHASATSLDFVRFALNEGVLRFGSFKVKSGRISPYSVSYTHLTLPTNREV